MDFKLGLLPERKINKRAIATAYGIVALVLLIVINLGIFLPEKLQLAQYHVTELIPMPALRPEPAPLRPKPEVHAKLLPAVKQPVFEQPKLVVPKEVRREIPQPVEAPKVVVNQFAATAVEGGGWRCTSAIGAHGRFRCGQFEDTDRECSGRKGADRRLRRSKRIARHRQAGREALCGIAGIV